MDFKPDKNQRALALMMNLEFYQTFKKYQSKDFQVAMNGMVEFIAAFFVTAYQSNPNNFQLGIDRLNSLIAKEGITFVVISEK